MVKTQLRRLRGVRRPGVHHDERAVGGRQAVPGQPLGCRPRTGQAGPRWRPSEARTCPSPRTGTSRSLSRAPPREAWPASAWAPGSGSLLRRRGRRARRGDRRRRGHGRRRHHRRLHRRPVHEHVGDSKEEQDRNLAAEHIKLLSEATKVNNQVFPAELRTDIPEFEVLDPNLPIMPLNQGTLPAGGLPAAFSQPFGPAGGLPDGLYTPGQDGLQTQPAPDPRLRRHRSERRLPRRRPRRDRHRRVRQERRRPSRGGAEPQRGGGAGRADPRRPTGTLPDTSVGGPTTSLAGLPDSTLAGQPTGYPSGNPSGSPSGVTTGTGPPGTGLGSPYGGSGAGAAVGGGAPRSCAAQAATAPPP